MASPKRIPIPLAQRWRSFCQSWLPIFGFLGSGALVMLLWSSKGAYTSFPGELLSPQTDATTQVVGKLIPLPGGVELTEFMHVNKNQLVAQLDPLPLLAQRKILVSKTEELRAEIESVTATVEFQDIMALQQFSANQASLLKYRSNLEVKLIQTHAYRNLAVVNLAQFREQERFEQDLIDRGISIRYRLLPIRRSIADSQEQITTSGSTIKTVEKEIAAAQQRIDQQPKLQKAMKHIEALLDPYRERIKTQEKMIAEVDQRLKTLKVYSTMEGVITMVHKKPGQAVQAGDPIVTIAATESPYVICYIRTDRTRRPDEGWQNMEVDIRFPTSYYGPITGYIEQVGPKVGQIVQQQLFDPQQPEYGLPVAIRIDWDKPEFKRIKTHIQPKPGELVYINFKVTRRKNPKPAAAKVVFQRNGRVRVSRLDSRQSQPETSVSDRHHNPTRQ